MEPSGLDYLQQVSKITIHRQFFTPHIFDIETFHGDQSFTAIKSSNLCTENCCEVDFKVMYRRNEDIIYLKQTWNGCCFSKPEMLVTIRDYGFVGTITTKSTCFDDAYDIENSNGDVMFRVKILGCFSVNYKILTVDGLEIGQIIRTYPCCERHSYVISFPVDLEIQYKALLLGACFLIVSGFFLWKNGLNLSNEIFFLSDFKTGTVTVKLYLKNVITAIPQLYSNN